MAKLQVDDEKVKQELARLVAINVLAHESPIPLLEHVRCLDPETQDEFRFHLDDPDSGWYWQRDVLDMWIHEPKSVVLKARQLGITWLAGAFALWYLLYRPGARVLIFSTKQTEAVKVINRIWEMMQSLPKVLWNGVTVYKPAKGARPQEEIIVVHRNGKASSIIAFTSSPSAGHGETAAFVILDEYSRQEYARDTWKAALATASKGSGRVAIISTGNGTSSMEGEEPVGNFFHHLWVNADEYGIEKRFLRWDLHPDRDEEWYRSHATMPSAERGEQYPRDEYEAFILTGSPYFDRDSLRWYAEEATRQPELRGAFETYAKRKALWLNDRRGWISVYERPAQDRKYVIAADTASGKGNDYSAAVVMCLQTMAPVAEFRGKLEPDLYAEQLHYLGRWYNDALIAPETAGGWGEPVITSLRDGRAGRPAYPNLYRHRDIGRVDAPLRSTRGFPMTSKTRPEVIGQLARAIRECSIPYVSGPMLAELRTFVHRKALPSPAADNGANDDLVMALAIACELYRQRGDWPDYERPKAIRGPKQRPLGSRVAA